MDAESTSSSDDECPFNSIGMFRGTETGYMPRFNHDGVLMIPCHCEEIASPELLKMLKLLVLDKQQTNAREFSRAYSLLSLMPAPTPIYFWDTIYQMMYVWAPCVFHCGHGSDPLDSCRSGTCELFCVEHPHHYLGNYGPRDQLRHRWDGNIDHPVGRLLNKYFMIFSLVIRELLKYRSYE